MKMRKPDYTESKNYTPPSQTFTPYKKDYRLDERKEVLVETGTLTNVQEMIQSALDTTFEALLSKYLPDTNVEDNSDQVTTLKTMQDDLSILSEAYEVAESYRDKFKLPDTMSAQEIFAHVTEQAKVLKDNINNHVTKKVQDENAQLKKQLEDLKNEKIKKASIEKS